MLQGLRILFAASTVVVTFAVLTQEPARSETRLLLAFLATCLFLVAVVEANVGSQSTRRATAEREDNPTAGTDSNVHARMRQLAKHRTDYVHTVSHELKTPLTSIRGFAELLAKGGVSSRTAELYANTIIDESDKLSRIVDDILDLTRMESTLLDLRRERFSVSDVISEVAARFSSVEELDGVRLDLQANLPSVRGDPARVTQVLNRLVLDALSRGTAEGPIVIEARESGDHVLMRLKYRTRLDQRDRIVRASEGLWQTGADGLSTRLGRGEIGLYIARNVIEAHGGQISIEGSERQVTISVRLPC